MVNNHNVHYRINLDISDPHQYRVGNFRFPFPSNIDFVEFIQQNKTIMRISCGVDAKF